MQVQMSMIIGNYPDEEAIQSDIAFLYQVPGDQLAQSTHPPTIDLY